ncbi:iron-sulfur protein [Planomonospora sp. ID67723]|uniref:hypothetical protein n=1 Tax=Planomonospora sp. ID67723 TaxID=2738134 RepID=UPI0018C35E8D|nr:hypothetical protein [Planomonospora sp. ID67723]MBG0829781.1 iron-sulfur protein [Planomonospora sp. ID67723]
MVEWADFVMSTSVDGAGPVDGAGWTRCADATGDPGFFLGWRTRMAAVLGERNGQAPETTVSACLAAAYAEVVAWAAGALFHLVRRTPDIGVTDVAFRHDGQDPWPVRIAFLSPGFTCLPDDPFADHPQARVVADEAALAARVREQVAVHAERFVGVFGPLTRLGRRALTGAFADALDSAPLDVARCRGDLGAAMRDSRLLLPGGKPPFTRSSTVRTVEDVRGRRHVSRIRQSCCYFYKLSHVADVCFTCPRQTDEARARIAAEWQVVS